MRKIKKAITIIAIIITIIVLYSLISPYIKQTVIESIDGYCLTIRDEYLIPYKYTKVIPPKEDYIKFQKKLQKNKSYGFEIGYINKTHLIIYDGKGISEINLPHFQYVIDSTYVAIDTFQTRFTVGAIDNPFHPQICINQKNIDTCYIYGMPWAKLYRDTSVTMGL